MHWAPQGLVRISRRDYKIDVEFAERTDELQTALLLLLVYNLTITC